MPVESSGSSTPSSSASSSSTSSGPSALPDDLLAALRAAAARDRVVLATDFDGVLAPLRDDPSASRPSPGTMDSLRAAAALPGTVAALVSGRDADTLAALSGVTDGDEIVVIGSHGGQSNRTDLVETTELTAEQSGLHGRLRAALEELTRRHPRSRVEIKPAAVVLHTRGLPEAEGAAALQEALAAGEAEPGVHVMPGKDVVELSVIDATKGLALTRLAASVGADATIYLGDDVTDETAFVALDPAAGDVTIKVGPGPTAAAYRIAGADDVGAVLAAFVTDRSRRA